MSNIVILEELQMSPYFRYKKEKLAYFELFLEESKDNVILKYRDKK